ncbi:MAG: AEC family transporter [Clostridia bacterium]|nr:AEC family transporter [Clostridia bacterium]
MLTVFSQVFTLFVFIATGYALAKCGIIKSGNAKLLSTLLVYVFSPCNGYNTFSQKFTLEYIKEKYALIISGIVLMLVLAVCMHFAAKLFSRDKYERSVYEYSLVLANYGYFGYALTESLLGSAALMDFMMFTLPAQIYVYTYAYCTLTKSKISLKRIINPVIIAFFLGGVVGITKVQLPSVIGSIASSGSSCMGPVSMLMAGIVMSDFKPRSLLTDKRTYILSAARLLVIPFTVGGLILAAGAALSLTENAVFNTVFICAVLFVSMPCGLNTIIFPRLVDENCEIGASLAFVSNILACVTIPIVLTAFGIGG